MTSVSGVLVKQFDGKTTSASKTMKQLITTLTTMRDINMDNLDRLIQNNIDEMNDKEQELKEQKVTLEQDTIKLDGTRDALAESTMMRKATTATKNEEMEAKDSAQKTFDTTQNQDEETKTNLRYQEGNATETINGLTIMLSILKKHQHLDSSRQLVQNLISDREKKESDLQLQLGNLNRDMTEDSNNFNTANGLALQSIKKLTSEEENLIRKVNTHAGEEKSGRKTVADDKKTVKDTKQRMHETSVDYQDDENNLKNLIGTLKSLIHDFTSTLDATSFIQTALAKRDPHAAKLELQSFASKYHNSEISKISAHLQDDACPWPIVNNALVQAQTTLNDDIQHTQKEKDDFSRQAEQLAIKSKKTCSDRDTAKSQADDAQATMHAANHSMNDAKNKLAKTESTYSIATDKYKTKDRNLNNELTETTESFKTITFGIQTVRERASSGLGGSDGGRTAGTTKDATSTETEGTKSILTELKNVSDELKQRMNHLKRSIEQEKQAQTKRTNTFNIQKQKLETEKNNARSEMQSEKQKLKTNNDKLQAGEMMLTTLNQDTYVLFDQMKSTTQKNEDSAKRSTPCATNSKTCGNLFQLADASEDNCQNDADAIDTHRETQVTNMELAMKEKHAELTLLKALTTDLKRQLQC